VIPYLNHPAIAAFLDPGDADIQKCADWS